MPPSKTPLSILIVGAGLGGLTAGISTALAGHKITILESAQALAEIGAGLQITPNGSRLLHALGLPESLWTQGAVPTIVSVHRYTGDVLAREEGFDQNIRKKYGDQAPFVDLHRVDLQKGLFERATELGVKFVFGERVKEVKGVRDGEANPTEEQPRVITESGKTFSADFIVAADGLWSACRSSFMPQAPPPKPTGDLAYRIVLTPEQLSDPADADLKGWVTNPEVHFWIGPGAHVVGYSVRGGEMYNIVLLVPDDLPEGVRKMDGSVDEMRALFDGWDPILQRFLDKVTSVEKWKLMHSAELPTWINKAGNFALLGDSCHPMLPYLAQGANSSLEDGAALGTVLSKITSKKDLPHALQVWQSVRKTRGEWIVKETFKQRDAFHMLDGEEQKARDQVFERRRNGLDPGMAFPSRWTCPVVQPILYGYDAIAETEEAWAKAEEKPLSNLSPKI